MGLMKDYMSYLEREIANIRQARVEQENRENIDMDCILEEYEERAAIVEFDGGYQREQAEAIASDIINRKYKIDITSVLNRQARN